jgi:hypothetical protein
MAAIVTKTAEAEAVTALDKLDIQDRPDIGAKDEQEASDDDEDEQVGQDGANDGPSDCSSILKDRASDRFAPPFTEGKKKKKKKKCMTISLSLRSIRGKLKYPYVVANGQRRRRKPPP